MSKEKVQRLDDSHAQRIRAFWQDRILSVEDDGVWISGMNANSGVIAKRIKKELENCGYSTVGPVDENGGLFVQVR